MFIWKTKSLIPLFLFIFIGLSSKNSQAFLGAAGNDRCGLGTMIFGSGQSVSSQSSEESTNGMSSGTSSITTGTSGCKSSGFVKATEEEVHYVNINYEELQLESSQGKGEVLAGLAETVGCSKMGEDRFGELMQKNYLTLFPISKSNLDTSLSNPETMLMGVKSLVEQDAVLSRVCARREG